MLFLDLTRQCGNAIVLSSRVWSPRAVGSVPADTLIVTLTSLLCPWSPTVHEDNHTQKKATLRVLWPDTLFSPKALSDDSLPLLFWPFPEF